MANTAHRFKSLPKVKNWGIHSSEWHGRKLGGKHYTVNKPDLSSSQLDNLAEQSCRVHVERRDGKTGDMVVYDRRCTTDEILNYLWRDHDIQNMVTASILDNVKMEVGKLSSNSKNDANIIAAVIRGYLDTMNKYSNILTHWNAWKYYDRLIRPILRDFNAFIPEFEDKILSDMTLPNPIAFSTKPNHIEKLFLDHLPNYKASDYNYDMPSLIEHASGFIIFDFQIPDVKKSINSLNKGNKSTMRNPVSYIRDEDKWERAKAIVKKDKKQKTLGKDEWPLIMYLYKKLGGKTKTNPFELYPSLMEGFEAETKNESSDSPVQKIQQVKEEKPKSEISVTAFPFLPLELIEQYRPLLEQKRVAPSAVNPDGFIDAYRDAQGNPNQISQVILEERTNFLKRHVAFVNKNNEQLWDKGKPTNRHLAFIAWGFSPDTVNKLEKFISAWAMRRVAG